MRQEREVHFPAPRRLLQKIPEADLPPLAARAVLHAAVPATELQKSRVAIFGVLEVQIHPGVHAELEHLGAQQFLLFVLVVAANNDGGHREAVLPGCKRAKRAE